MTEKQLEKWMEQTTFIDSLIEHDSCGNDWRTSIYQIGEKLYAVDYCNESPISRNRVKDEALRDYTPIEVVKKTRQIEEIYYYSPETQTEYV